MDRVRMFRRIASQAHWEYQQSGVALSREVASLRRLQGRRDGLQQEIAGLEREQLAQVESGALNAEGRRNALGLIGELSAGLQAWDDALQQQLLRVARARRALARARTRRDKTGDKYREVQQQRRDVHLYQEARELEDIYTNNRGLGK